MNRIVQPGSLSRLPLRKIPPFSCQLELNLQKLGYVNCHVNDIRKFASVSHAMNKGWSFSQLRQVRKELHAWRALLERSGLQLEGISSAAFNEQRRKYSNENNEKKTDDKEKEEDEEKRKRMNINYIVFNILSVLVILTVTRALMSYNTIEISWADFEKDVLSKGMVRGARVSKVYSDKGQKEVITIFCHPEAIIKGTKFMFPGQFYLSGPVGWFESKVQEFERVNGIIATDRLPINYSDETVWGNTPFILFAALLAGLSLYALFKNAKPPKIGGPSGQGKKETPNSMSDMINDMIREPMKLNVKRGDQMVQNLKFKDVAGLHEAKQEVIEFVDYIKSPDRFKRLGATVPKGALLLGPPGCGKTLLAKALAAEAQVPFFAHAGTEFVEMIGGLGASRVRSLFKSARENRPCIVFVDEIDAIGSQRSKGNMTEGNSEAEQTLNQLLVEMDGMGTEEGVLILAATNRSDILDKALLRPGRFDRHILIDLPTVTERVELFELYLSKLKLEKPISAYAVKLAQRTPGMSGADIANVCNEGAIHAAREHKKVVTLDDLEYAIERVVAGVAKTNNTLTVGEKNITAYHESGHALVEWLSSSQHKLLKVSIVPRTSAKLGFSQYSTSDLHLQTKEDLFEKMCALLAGRVAESLVFNKVTTGAEDDLKKVTNIANSMVQTFGMNDKVGQLSFPTDAEQSGLSTKPYSHYLRNIMDEEARKLVQEAYKHTEEVLRKNLDKLHKLADALLTHETLDYVEVEKLIGPPPHQKYTTIEDPTEFFGKY